MSELFERVKDLAKERHLSLAQLNNMAGLGTNSIYSWKTSTPRTDALEQVAKALHVSINQLLEDKPEDESDSSYRQIGLKAAIDNHEKLSQVINMYPAGKSPVKEETDKLKDKEVIDGIQPTNYQVRVPVLGQIACGDPILAEQNIEGYQDLTFSHKPHGTLFILKCKGHSMEPTIPNGSFVTVEQMSEVENGQVAAVLVDDEATLKRVYYHDDYVLLKPDNPNFGTIKMNKDNPGQVLGKVVHIDWDIQQ